MLNLKVSDHYFVSFVDILSGVPVNHYHFNSFTEFCRSLYQVCVEKSQPLPYVTYSDSYAVRVLFSFDSDQVTSIFSSYLTFSDILDYVFAADDSNPCLLSAFSRYLASKFDLHFDDSNIGEFFTNAHS